MAWVEAAARDVKGAGGEALILAGEYLPAEVHALVYGLNAALGGGRSGAVRYVEAVEVWPDKGATLSDLTKAMDAGEVDLLVLLDVNPVYQAPGDLAPDTPGSHPTTPVNPPPPHPLPSSSPRASPPYPATPQPLPHIAPPPTFLRPMPRLAHTPAHAPPPANTPLPESEPLPRPP